MGFSADGTTVALFRHDSVEPRPDGGTRTTRTTRWTVNVDTGREGPAITLDGTLLAGNHLSPDGTRLVVGRYDGTLGIYDLTGERVAQQFTVGTQ